MWNWGPVSLGMVTDLSLVSLSGNNSEDLLFSRIWQGLFLYQAKSFADINLKEPPFPSGKAGVLMFAASDLDIDGDSFFDIVRPGDESGVGFYRQLR